MHDNRKSQPIEVILCPEKQSGVFVCCMNPENTAENMNGMYCKYVKSVIFMFFLFSVGFLV